MPNHLVKIKYRYHPCMQAKYKHIKVTKVQQKPVGQPRPQTLSGQIHFLKGPGDKAGQTYLGVFIVEGVEVLDCNLLLSKCPDGGQTL